MASRETARRRLRGTGSGHSPCSLSSPVTLAESLPLWASVFPSVKWGLVCRARILCHPRECQNRLGGIAPGPFSTCKK